MDQGNIDEVILAASRKNNRDRRESASTPTGASTAPGVPETDESEAYRAPVRTRVRRVQTVSKEVAEKTAEQIVSMVNGIATQFAGPEGQMSIIEQMMILPSLSHTLQRVPKETLEKSGVWTDTALLAGALLLWTSRLARIMMPKPKAKKETTMPQESYSPADSVEPQRPTDGGHDANGISAPAPDEIMRVLIQEGI